MTTVRSEVAKQVTAALEQDPRTSEFTIEVVDQNGVITLKGTVNSQAASQAAEEIAKKQPGVIEVVNGLLIKQEPDLPDPTKAPPAQAL